MSDTTYVEIRDRHRKELDAFTATDLQARIAAVRACPICGSPPIIKHWTPGAQTNYGIIEVTCTAKLGHSVRAVDHGNMHGAYADEIWNGDRHEVPSPPPSGSEGSDD